MATNGHGRVNGVHWTQTEKGKAKMALVQRKAWRTRRKNAKLKAAKKSKAAKSIKRGLKQAARNEAIRHANGTADRVSRTALFDIKATASKRLWERGLMREGALARLERYRQEERHLQRFLD